MSDTEPAGRLRWSTLDGPSTPAWSELTNLLARVENTEEFYSAEDLAEELEEAGFDPRRDSWAVWNGKDLVGYGQLRVAAELLEGRWCRADLDGGVHPDWRGRGIGTRLMDLMEARGRELAAQRHPGAPLRFRVPGRLDGDPVRPLLERRGYRLARFFTEMERALPGDPLPPADPRVRTYRPELSEAVRLAHNEAFAAHWGSTPQTPETWRDRLGSRTFRPDVSAVVLDGDGADGGVGGDGDGFGGDGAGGLGGAGRGDGVGGGPGGDGAGGGDAAGGEVLAYVLSYQWVDGELYIGQVGTRRRARGQGLAKACLVAALRAAAASGRYHSVDLTVDSANSTGAGALYESVGFTAVRTTASYVRDEDPPPE